MRGRMTGRGFLEVVELMMVDESFAKTWERRGKRVAVCE